MMKVLSLILLLASAECKRMSRTIQVTDSNERSEHGKVRRTTASGLPVKHQRERIDAGNGIATQNDSNAQLDKLPLAAPPLGEPLNETRQPQIAYPHEDPSPPQSSNQSSNSSNVKNTASLGDQLKGSVPRLAVADSFPRWSAFLETSLQEYWTTAGLKAFFAVFAVLLLVLLICMNCAKDMTSSLILIPPAGNKCTDKKSQGSAEKKADLAKDVHVQSIDDGVNRTFRWFSLEDAAAAALPTPDDVAKPISGTASSSSDGISWASSDEIEAIPPIWTPEALQGLFLTYGIDVSSWQTDRMQNLAMEFATGKGFLMLTRSGKLRRVIDFIEVVIVHPTQSEFILVEEKATKDFSQVLKHAFTKSATEYRKNLKKPEAIPSTRKQAGETHDATAKRLLESKVGAPEGSIKLNWSKVKSIDVEETSEYFPGLTTIVRKRIVTGTVVTVDPLVLQSLAVASSLSSSEQVGQFTVSLHGQVYNWTWKALEKIPELAKFRGWIKGTGGQNPKGRTSRPQQLARDRSGSLSLQQNDHLQVVVPWTEAQVEALLEEHKVDAETFGMSLEELAEQATFNSVYFGQRRSDQKLVAIKDVVFLRVVAGEHKQAALVEACPDNKVSKGNLQWPSCVRRLDESAWDTARRLVRTKLQLCDDAIEFSFTPQELSYENAGCDTMLNRRWLMAGCIPEGMEHLCARILSHL